MLGIITRCASKFSAVKRIGAGSKQSIFIPSPNFLGGVWLSLVTSEGTVEARKKQNCGPRFVV